MKSQDIDIARLSLGDESNTLSLHRGRIFTDFITGQLRAIDDTISTCFFHIINRHRLTGGLRKSLRYRQPRVSMTRAGTLSLEPQPLQPQPLDIGHTPLDHWLTWMLVIRLGLEAS